MSESEPQNVIVNEEDPEPLSLYPNVVPIRPDIVLEQPASKDTIEAIIRAVKELTPPPTEGMREAFVFKRERRIVTSRKRKVVLGGVVLSQLGFFGVEGSAADNYHQGLKDEEKEKEIVNIDVYNHGSPQDFYVVSINDEGDYVLTKNVTMQMDASDMEGTLETVTILDETAALGVLGMVRSLEEQETV